MENINKLKEIGIKNYMCYHFDDIIKFKGFNLDNVLINEKAYEIILVYEVSYETLIGVKPLCISFDKINGFTRVYDGTRYLVLFRPENNDAILNRIRYLIGVEKRYYL